MSEQLTECDVYKIAAAKVVSNAVDNIKSGTGSFAVVFCDKPLLMMNMISDTLGYPRINDTKAYDRDASFAVTIQDNQVVEIHSYSNDSRGDIESWKKLKSEGNRLVITIDPPEDNQTMTAIANSFIATNSKGGGLIFIDYRSSEGVE